ncbi:hypothetical protein E5288_WYG011484 [Bos mutus]|uniref:SAM-dependent MTase RsmB/NOP-type domain-containing protein n=1 Tax=Bos mutus TaxID=72004 RepID=A0A6B0SEJ8_9CETA|nr:hypothetical protein [Bos mutus]
MHRSLHLNSFCFCRKNIKQQPCEVIVGAQCGSAVLRGAHVYVPGIVSASKFMKGGDDVSVYSDIKGKCKKGAKEFDGTKIFLGNGISELSRKEIFSGLPELKGVGVRMTEPVYLSPSFDNVLPSYLFLQVSGEVIALDKISKKVEKIKQNALLLGLNSIRAFCFDGTKALKLDMVKDTDGEPPFLPESFDRILLDAPCSGMGQRPNMACTWTLKEVMSYQPLQRKLFTVAVELLKPGGVLVYSTCTVTLAENEEQVAWALEAFPGLQLQHQVRTVAALSSPVFFWFGEMVSIFSHDISKPKQALITGIQKSSQAGEDSAGTLTNTRMFICVYSSPEQDPQVGGEGMLGAGLSPEQLKRLQRFDPSAMWSLDRDIGSLRDASIEDLIKNETIIEFGYLSSSNGRYRLLEHLTHHPREQGMSLTPAPRKAGTLSFLYSFRADHCYSLSEGGKTYTKCPKTHYVTDFFPSLILPHTQQVSSV